MENTSESSSTAAKSGRFLPLVATLNAARVLDSTATVLGVDHAGLSDLALAAPAGAGGAVLVPYFDGERTPDRPHATASLHGLTLESWTPALVARAAVEGLLCGLADAIDALVAQGARVDRVLLVGGGTSSPAARRIAPSVFGRPVHVSPPGEYVARGCGPPGRLGPGRIGRPARLGAARRRRGRGRGGARGARALPGGARPRARPTFLARTGGTGVRSEQCASQAHHLREPR